MATNGDCGDRVRETYRAEYDLQPRQLPRKPHWILASPPEQRVKDIFDDKGDEVAQQFFLLNSGLPTTEFTVENLINFVVKTLMREPKGTTRPRKVSLIFTIPCLADWVFNPWTPSSFDDHDVTWGKPGHVH